MYKVKVKVLVARSCLTLRPPWSIAARLLCPWNSPGKNSGVGCYSTSPGGLPHPGIESALQADSFLYKIDNKWGTQWWPIWEGNWRKRGYMCTWGWFTLPYSRKQHNIVKQLNSNYEKKKRKRKISPRGSNALPKLIMTGWLRWFLRSLLKIGFFKT